MLARMSNDTSLRLGAPAASSPYLSALLSELDASGKGTAAFAREHGLAPWRLYNALNKRNGKRRRSRARTAASQLVPVHVVESPSAPSPIELVLPGGICLRIPVGFDEVALRRVIDVLGRC